MLALEQPERFEKLVLEGTVLPGFLMLRTAELQARASSISRSSGVTAALEDWLGCADWFANMREHPATTNAAGQRELVNEFAGAPWLSDLTPGPAPDVRSRLGLIRQPTLVYNGEHDLEEFKQVAAVLEAELAKAERLVIPDAGGFPLWENPDAAIPAVVEFLEKLGARRDTRPEGLVSHTRDVHS